VIDIIVYARLKEQAVLITEFGGGFRILREYYGHISRKE
jgi:hypothetical protein